MKKKILTALLRGAMKHYKVGSSEILANYERGDRLPKGLEDCRSAFLWGAKDLGLPTKDACALINLNHGNSVAKLRRWHGETPKLEKEQVWRAMQGELGKVVDKRDFKPAQ